MHPRHFLGLVLICTASSCHRSDLAPGVDPEAIKSVKLGMKLGDVIDILGMPYSVEALHSVHMNDCPGLGPRPSRDVSSPAQIRSFLDSTFSAVPCCSANKRELEERHFVLNYSRMVALQSESPMLWIHFDRRGQVREVFAKLNGKDDLGIYLLKWQQVMGTTEVDTTRVMRDCKEELLHKYFSR